MHDLPPPNTPASHYEQVYDVNKADRAAIHRSAFACMALLEGWCAHEKAAILMDIILRIHPETVVEIGVWGGKSLVPMAIAMKACNKGKIYGIDPWSNEASVQGLTNEVNRSWWGVVNHNQILQGLKDKLDEFELRNVVLIESTSAAAAPIYNIDILHIDGNHSEEASYLDVIKWVPLVRKGGWIVFDDINWVENGKGTTRKAVEWLNENCVPFGTFFDTCEWGIWLKP